MNIFFESLMFIVLVFCAVTLVSLIILNIYLLKRNGFYVNVNCWFCNTWIKVPYHDKNSFDCTSCLQYNGFKKDGDYNKIIKAQYMNTMNKYSNIKTENCENGLCTYCNNNMQLKVYQLAKFTPINEDTYDLEVEHFEKQLEKAYKLCKKCESHLKYTLNKQHSWLFGKRLKDLRKKKINLPYTKPKNIQNSFFVTTMRYSLIVISVLVLCYILDVKIMYPNINMNKYLPINVFNSFENIYLEFYNMVINYSKQIKIDTEKMKWFIPQVQSRYFSALLLTGCILHLLLSLCENFRFLWKLHGFSAWFLLILMPFLSLKDRFPVPVFLAEIFASAFLVTHYIWYFPTGNVTKEYRFKKVIKSTKESSEDETDEEISYRNVSPKSRNLYVYPKSNFNTAKSVTSTSDIHSSSSSDLNQSLDNLHLGFKSSRARSPVYSVNSITRPILYPSKLKNITQNPWTAGGFWKNNSNIFSAAVDARNLSRSSSQSSGFISNHDFVMNNAFNSREPSINGDIDKVSVLSEPTYHFSPISSPPLSSASVRSSQLYYKTGNNTFYPVLNPHNMLFIQNGIPQQSFSNSSLRNFNSCNNVATVSGLINHKPVSPLFKNIQKSHNFTETQTKTPINTAPHLYRY